MKAKKCKNCGEENNRLTAHSDFCVICGTMSPTKRAKYRVLKVEMKMPQRQLRSFIH